MKLFILTLGMIVSTSAFAAAKQASYVHPVDCPYANRTSAHDKDKRQAASEKYNEFFKMQSGPKKNTPTKAVI